MPEAALSMIENWYAARGWTPFDFQRETWRAYAEGRSGLIHAPTGMGKTLAVWLGPVMESLREYSEPRRNSAGPARDRAEPLRVLWITPMRALAADTVLSLRAPIEDLGLNWTIEKRTGDTPQSQKLKQRERLPTALITTPESLSLLLSYPGSREAYSTLRCIVVDEWHELLSTKRGTQAELCLARLRALAPGVRTWGLSATIGNLEEALEVLEPRRTRRDTEQTVDSLNTDSRVPPCRSVPAALNPVLIRGETHKRFEIKTLLPKSVERFPWAGHLGLQLVDQVLREIECARTTLLFTNTRSQAELWYRAILEARPDWLKVLAIHHGSLDRVVRTKVEQRLKAGELLCVVCTSSLDLGVDFLPVEQVIQVGSPKGVARLMQRAGRSGHQPGEVSRVVCVPTNALELLEFAAAREAMQALSIEERKPLEKPLDVLTQHLVTVGLAGMFHVEHMFEEVRSTRAYRDLTAAEWDWCLDFIISGGPTLGAYPRFARARRLGDSVHVDSPHIARLHRLGIGTISSDPAMIVRYIGGGAIGTIEESFIARLAAGDRFVLGGRPVELVRVRDMTAFVKRAKSLRGAVPRWEGGRSPLSTLLSHAVRRSMSKCAEFDGEPLEPEARAIRPLLDLQARRSRVPKPDELLIEMLESDDGFHVFIYPFEGRLVHEGLGALVAHRLTRDRPRSITVSANDYGFELLSDERMVILGDEVCSSPLPPPKGSGSSGLLSSENLLDDLGSCLNSTELTRRQFRDIARVAGLLVPGYPGAARSARQAQASSSLFFDVFSEFDPANRLLEQARREVMEQQLEVGRMRAAMDRMSAQRIVTVRLDHLSPLSFPLWAESLRTQHVTSESWSARVRKMAVRLEEEARHPRGGRKRKTVSV